MPGAEYRKPMSRRLIVLAAVLWITPLIAFAGMFHLGGIALLWSAVGLAIAAVIPAVRRARAAAIGLATLLCIACVLLAMLLGPYFLPAALALLGAAIARPHSTTGAVAPV